MSFDVLLEGKPLIRWTGKQSAIGVAGGWEIPEMKRPGLGAFESGVTFHSARLRLITGEGNWTSSAAAPAAAAEPPEPAKPAPPSLLRPRPGAVLPNGTSDRSRTMAWEFKWSAVPGASRYHLYVMGAKATIPLVDRFDLTAPEYRYESRGFIADHNRPGWRWKVRALVGGSWTAWSEEQTFDVGPLQPPEPPKAPGQASAPLPPAQAAVAGSGKQAQQPVIGQFVFPAEKLNQLRDKAIRAVELKGERPVGWTISQADPMRLVAAFDGLKLKKGFVLRAYDYYGRFEGRAVLWAMPEKSELPAPDQCPKVKLKEIAGEVPKPLAALDDFTDLIEGEGSPWSYLCASIMTRELKEMHPFWHALDWRTHVILGQNPWEPGSPKVESVGHAISPRPQWRWHETEPKSWQPTVRVEKDKITVTFYTFSAFRGQVSRHVDTFKPASYRFQTQVEAIASCGGFKF